MGGEPGSPRWAGCHHKGLYRRGRARVRGRDVRTEWSRADAALTVKPKEGSATSQGHRCLQKPKKARDRASPEGSRRTLPSPDRPGKTRLRLPTPDATR